MRKIIFLAVFLFPLVAVADNVANGPPQVYQPTYVYGSTPMGVYLGNPEDLGDSMLDGDDMVMPDGEGMAEHQTQSGEQEQSFQFIQGQEDLMADHSKQALKAYNQQQVIGAKLEQQYQQQIDQQTHQAAQPAINLPNM